MESHIRNELIKLVRIKAFVVSDFRPCAPDIIRNIQYVQHQLSAWYDALPGEMQLSNVVKSDNMPPTTRAALLYVHLFHLCGVCLVQRQVLKYKKDHLGELDSLSADALAVMTQAIKAGSQAAAQATRMLDLLLQEQTMFQKCWLCM